MKENLSFRRMWQLCRYYWRTEKKLYLRLYLGLMALYVFKTLFLTGFSRLLSPEQFSGAAIVVSDEWLFWGFILICTARMFAWLESKQRAITFLSLPASRLEKYLSRVVYATLGIYVLALAARLTVGLMAGTLAFLAGGLSLTDVLRAYILPTGWIISSAMFTESISLWTLLRIALESTLVALWPWSLFTLFGLLFRRHGWLWAIPVLFFGVLVVMMLAWFTPITFFLVVCLVIVCSLLNYWLAYICFCRAQVIENQLSRL